MQREARAGPADRLAAPPREAARLSLGPLQLSRAEVTEVLPAAAVAAAVEGQVLGEHGGPLTLFQLCRNALLNWTQDLWLGGLQESDQVCTKLLRMMQTVLASTLRQDPISKHFTGPSPTLQAFLRHLR